MDIAPFRGAFGGREFRLVEKGVHASFLACFYFFSLWLFSDSEGCPSSVGFGSGKGKGFGPFLLSNRGPGLSGQRTLDLGSPRDMVRNSEESPNILGGLIFIHGYSRRTLENLRKHYPRGTFSVISVWLHGFAEVFRSKNSLVGLVS